MKKEYVLLGLDCPNCAAKIETDVKSQAGILSASCSAMNESLILEIENDYAESITGFVEKIVRKYEPHVAVKLKGEVNVKEDADNGKNQLIWIASGFILFVAAILSKDMGIQPYLYLASYAVLGWEIIFKAVRNIFKGQIFDENFLMSIATIGAILLGEYPEAAAILLFYLVGEYFQDAAVRSSRRSIADLMDIRPDFANVSVKGELRRVAPETVRVGDIIVVKPGERIPLDGKVIDGESMLDTAALTGESLPKEVGKSDSVISGCINQSGVLIIEVTKSYGESTVAKIIDLVENASSKKAPTENFITAFSRYYTPVVVGLAALLAIISPLLFGGEWSEWVRRALVFLVISCPCALVISIPLGFFGGIGGASRKGVLVKGGNYLEALNNLDIVVFDKTGTLTKGVFEVTCIEPANGISEEQLLKYTAYAEVFSNHPIALSIMKAYGEKIDERSLTDYEETPGHGISVKASGISILAGNDKLMKKENIDFVESEKAGTKVYVAENGNYAGCVIISDKVKADSREAIKALRELGIGKTVMLTGDNEMIAENIAKELSIDEVYAQLLPSEKVEKVEELSEQKRPSGKLAFVGDGINDAPVLARADIGIAMGGLGSDAAIEAADVVLMTDEPSKLIDAIKIARKTKSIVLQNIVFALGVKIVFLTLGAFGISGMWEAVFADVGVSMLAILNSLRAMR